MGACQQTPRPPTAGGQTSASPQSDCSGALRRRPPTAPDRRAGAVAVVADEGAAGEAVGSHTVRGRGPAPPARKAAASCRRLCRPGTRSWAWRAAGGFRTCRHRRSGWLSRWKWVRPCVRAAQAGTGVGGGEGGDRGAEPSDRHLKERTKKKKTLSRIS